MKFFLVVVFVASLILLGFGISRSQKWQLTPTENPPKKISLYNCSKYKPREYSQRLNNTLNQYIYQSSKEGIPAVENEQGLEHFLSKKKLIRIKAGIGYQLDRFKHSYPLLTPYAKNMLESIGKAFHDSLIYTPLNGVDLLVTSLTRTKESVFKLVRSNRTAVIKSPHLNGNTFDFSFSRFRSKRMLTVCERHYLQELISSILFKLNRSHKIWVTFERKEECLHVVTKK